MARPRNKRKVESAPLMKGFRPFGVPSTNLEPVILLFEEYEAIRLADYEMLNHEEAAEKMHVSRPTFTRIYRTARASLARAFIEGQAIMIEGGNYKMEYTKGYCICINCDTRIPHKKGIPCRESKCPDCGKTMLREHSYHHRLYLQKQKEKNDEISSSHHE